jgi:hypothetical protein
MDLLQFQNNLLSINVWELLKPILRRYLPEILDANTRQLRRGELNDGDLLEMYKSAAYLDFKESLASYKAPSGVADLFVTGDFQDAFFGEVNDEGITFDSNDEKTEVLERRYSSDLFGIQPKEWEVIKQDQIIPELVKAIQMAIFKN